MLALSLFDVDPLISNDAVESSFFYVCVIEFLEEKKIKNDVALL